MTEEIWKDIKDYEGLYQISNLGNIKNLKTNIVKTPSSSNIHSYLVVRLVKNKKGKCFNAHRLVAQAFIPNPDMLPIVNHIDGNIHNNRVENLEWVTNRQNMFHWINERKKELDPDLLFIKNFTGISILQICKLVNANRSNILSGTASKEKIHQVRMELEKQINNLWNEDFDYKNK